MDCNMRSPLWDWEHLIMSNPSKTENDKRQPWETEKGEGIESIIFPSFTGLERVSSGSTTCFSTNSSSPIFRHAKLASQSSPGDSFSNIDFVHVKTSSTALEVSAESDLCLKLGKQTYSEDYNNEVSAVPMKLLAPSVATRKKSKACGQSSMQVPRCQVDGCELDLSSAKDYHRKHRVCEKHSKCPKITVGGLERRFCQQCSRLHAVSEFDEKKRSCRKRLSHHNARRRKPQGVFPLNPERDCNGRQHPNMLWNGLSLNTSSDEKYAAWSPSYDTKPTQMEGGFTLSFQRGRGPEEQLYASSSRSFSAFQTSGGFSAGRSNSQLPGKGVGEYSGGLHESQDFYSALSLLSTSSDSRGTKHNPMVEPQPTHGTFPTHFI
ncbi:Squamosa promoter-binding-like protein 10 [Hirschfeldia incana]|nr:Squamosa promoter-binding-like protein 10 [Hirschfeldia incana]